MGLLPGGDWDRRRKVALKALIALSSVAASAGAVLAFSGVGTLAILLGATIVPIASALVAVVLVLTKPSKAEPVEAVPAQSTPSLPRTNRTILRVAYGGGVVLAVLGVAVSDWVAVVVGVLSIPLAYWFGRQWDCFSGMS